jgi:hypothetical protein
MQNMDFAPSGEICRRAFLRRTASVASLGMATLALNGVGAYAAEETYATIAKGIRILPGHWRPHYEWEHIAWVSPSWPSQDYIWLDFPEAIFTDRGLLYLSHINPDAAAVYEGWPKVPWETIDGGIAFERELPDGVAFGGKVTGGSDTIVDLELHITNGSAEPLRSITLQTCAYLRAIKEFGEYTRDNKYVHIPGNGWQPYPVAVEAAEGQGPFGVGWRSRNGKSDLPVMATLSKDTERLVAMTWFDDTLSMVSNGNHPCMHADPHFPDLEPGENRTIHGGLIFFEGNIDDFRLTSSRA